MVFLAEHLKDDNNSWEPLVIMGSEIPFPFQLARSDLQTPWLEVDIVSTMPLMEQWQIPARLASLTEYRRYVSRLRHGPGARVAEVTVKGRVE